MPHVHVIYDPTLGERAHDASLTITGEEARHALRVKRLEPGDAVRVCDGKGLVLETTLQESRKARSGDWQLLLRAGAPACRTPPPSPRVLVYAPAPKGEALEQMIDGLSQVGAAAWVCLESARTVVHPRDAKLARLERIAVESLKQCGRAWLLETGAKASWSEALAQSGTVVVADSTGTDPLPTGAERIALLIGPEGGWTPEELAAARATGAKVCRFGPHTMRIETAAVVACARLLPAG